MWTWIPKEFVKRTQGVKAWLGAGLDGVEGSSGEEGLNWRVDVYTEDGLWNDVVGNIRVLVQLLYWKWLRTSHGLPKVGSGALASRFQHSQDVRNLCSCMVHSSR